MDAGHAYNTFPLMDGRLIPEEYWALPGWRNAFENTAAVQLHHRALALCTLGAVTALWARARTLPLPPSSRLLVHAMMGMAALQVRLITFYALPPVRTLPFCHCSIILCHSWMHLPPKELCRSSYSMLFI
jgi:heme A synthase